MSHNPVNHPARPIYRAIGGLIGVYLVLFGVLGIARTSGGEFFARDDTLVLGQGTNLASSVISAVLGVIILAVTLIGRNIDTAVHKFLGYFMMAFGLASLAVLRTDANYLNFSVTTTIVFMVIGLVLLMAGMYGKVGSDDDVKAFEHARLFS